jgi:glucose 1-dehydrogenase
VRAITVEPGVADSARLEDVPEPDSSRGRVVVRTIAMGVCGTDLNIIKAEYGSAPEGESRLILGHESLGEVVEAPKDSGLKPGQHVAGIVRWPDPVPCDSCRHGEWDMCRNGKYTEHGIKGVHGFGAEYFRLDPDRLVPVDRSLGIAGVLMEPASILAKAWEHIDRFAARTRWCPNRVLVTGAGPIGLLGALLGVQRGHEVHVLDQVTDGPKPRLVESLGAQYHCSDVEQAGRDADIVLECTGVGQLIGDVMHVVAPSGIVCLTGVSSGGRELPFDIEGLNRTLVLENNVVFGTVNANRRHYEQAAEALAKADGEWLHELITRTVSLDDWESALERQEHDVKPVIRFGG